LLRENPITIGYYAEAPGIVTVVCGMPSLHLITLNTVTTKLTFPEHSDSLAVELSALDTVKESPGHLLPVEEDRADPGCV